MKDNVKALAAWIESMKEAAKKDEQFSVAWFKPTENDHFAIVAGWMSGFSEDYSDLLCISKSNPEWAMCVKIVENEGPYAYCDFEVLNMPVDETGEVDNTCIALEYNDNSEALAEFFISELERMTDQALAKVLGVPAEKAYVS